MISSSSYYVDPFIFFSLRKIFLELGIPKLRIREEWSKLRIGNKHLSIHLSVWEISEKNSPLFQKSGISVSEFGDLNKQKFSTREYTFVFYYGVIDS